MKRTVMSAVLVLMVVTLWIEPHSSSQLNPLSDPTHMQTAELLQPIATVGRVNLMPLAFTENNGQWDDRVRFRASAGGATIWITADGIYYQFTRRIPQSDGSSGHPRERGNHDSRGGQMPQRFPVYASASAPFSESSHDEFDHQSDSIERLVIRASFLEANLNTEIEGEGLME